MASVNVEGVVRRTLTQGVGIATLIFRYFLRYVSSTHRTDLSRFRGTFHSFDPVGFAIFAILGRLVLVGAAKLLKRLRFSAQPVCHVHDTTPALGRERRAGRAGNDWGRAAKRRWRTWQHAMAGLAGVACWPRCGETFNPIRGELGWIALPQACSLNDPLGHKLPDRNVTRVEINAGLFVRNSHDPRGFGIERRPFNQSKPGHVPSAIYRLHCRMDLHGLLSGT